MDEGLFLGLGSWEAGGSCGQEACGRPPVWGAPSQQSQTTRSPVCSLTAGCVTLSGTLGTPVRSSAASGALLKRNLDRGS